MQLMIDYILKNGEWIFSGVGVFCLGGAIWLIRRLFFSNVVDTSVDPGTPSHRDSLQREPGGHRSNRSGVGVRSADDVSNVEPDNWQGIVPTQSRYEFVRETSDSIPLGPQLFSFEYGPHGHAKALTLKGSIVRAEIQFTCRIINPYKAMFSANEYALNVLQPKFLVQARNVLEKYSLTKLRDGRQDIAREIHAGMSLQFQELGVRLDSVTIGALDKLGHVQ